MLKVDVASMRIGIRAGSAVTAATRRDATVVKTREWILVPAMTTHPIPIYILAQATGHRVVGNGR